MCVFQTIKKTKKSIPGQEKENTVKCCFKIERVWKKQLVIFG